MDVFWRLFPQSYRKWKCQTVQSHFTWYFLEFCIISGEKWEKLMWLQVKTQQDILFICTLNYQKGRQLMLAICNKYVMRRSHSPQLCNCLLLEIRPACGGVCGCQGGASFTHRKRERSPGLLFIFTNRRKQKNRWPCLLPSSSIAWRIARKLIFWDKISQLFGQRWFPWSRIRGSSVTAFWRHLEALHENFSFTVQRF